MKPNPKTQSDRLISIRCRNLSDTLKEIILLYLIVLQGKYLETELERIELNGRLKYHTTSPILDFLWKEENRLMERLSRIEELIIKKWFIPFCTLWLGKPVCFKEIWNILVIIDAWSRQFCDRFTYFQIFWSGRQKKKLYEVEKIFECERWCTYVQIIVTKIVMFYNLYRMLHWWGQ